MKNTIKKALAGALNIILAASIISTGAAAWADEPEIDDMSDDEAFEEAVEENEEEPVAAPDAESLLEYRELTEGNVTVCGLMPADAELCVKDLGAENCGGLAAGRELAFAMDISILSNGEEWEPVEPVQVTINIDAEAGADIEILHLEDGDAQPRTVAETGVGADGKISFEAFGFSVYVGAKAETEAAEHADANITFPPAFTGNKIPAGSNDTTESILVWVVFPIVAGAAAAVAVWLVIKRKEAEEN